MFQKVRPHQISSLKNFINVLENGYIYISSGLKRIINDKYDMPYYTDIFIDEENKVMRLKPSDDGDYTICANGNGAGLKLHFSKYKLYGIKPGRYYNITFGKDYIDISYKEEPNNG